MPHGDPDYPDALPNGLVHRRASALNPANRFEKVRLHVLGEELDRQHAERLASDDPDRLPRVDAQIFPDRTQTIINRVTATSDVPFEWTVNPYRGCEHGCIYCFARNFHEYLGFSSGLDFETKLTAKHDAADLLRRELAAPAWRGEPIVMSAITDIYQPIEHKLQIARQCLQVMADCGQPVTTMTKGALVLRDADLWSQMSKNKTGRVTVTLVTLDHDLAQRLEPRAATPGGRLRVIRELTKAGVDVSVNIAPVIPGLTDTEIPQLLEAVADAGAKRVFWVMLRLPYQLKALFLDWLARNVHPYRARHVESLIRQSRNGKLYDASPEAKLRGKGPVAEQVAQLFEVFTRRYKLNQDLGPLSRAHFRPPTLPGSQMSLF